MIERRFAVFPAGGAKPVCYVNTAERDVLVRSGAATRFGRRRACLRLRSDGAGCDMSRYMSPGVMRAHVAGDPRAQIATLGWSHR
jgi:hypothetical protein